MYIWTIFIKKFLQLMLVSSFTSWNSEKKGIYSIKTRLGCVLIKKRFCIMNKIKLVFIHYTEIIFLSKYVIFLWKYTKLLNILKLFSSEKGSLYTMIPWKYTELLQLKNIFRIFWNYFWNILETSVFKSQKCKKWLFFKWRT